MIVLVNDLRYVSVLNKHSSVFFVGMAEFNVNLAFETERVYSVRLVSFVDVLLLFVFVEPGGGA